MTLHRLVTRLGTSEAAYIAGLIDGEGTVTLTRAHRNENRRLVVCISNNETYRLSSRQALDLLRQIVGYMNSYKAIRTRLALNKYLPLTPRNGRYTIAQLAARDEFEAEFLAIRP